ncbi:hypothetical protein ACE10Z_10080 [Bradyrhizobium sp. Pha-3]|uniref:hypothetical protein n=1 Tax=Bradyrhizobium sp. Pha-3 TaxID=208375 RepID=UPI0035D44798
MSPETVVVGPQGSRRIQMHVSGEIHLFNILLQPSARIMSSRSTDRSILTCR